MNGFRSGGRRLEDVDYTNRWQRRWNQGKAVIGDNGIQENTFYTKGFAQFYGFPISIMNVQDE